MESISFPTMSFSPSSEIFTFLSCCRKLKPRLDHGVQSRWCFRLTLLRCVKLKNESNSSTCRLNSSTSIWAISEYREQVRIITLYRYSTQFSAGVQDSRLGFPCGFETNWALHTRLSRASLRQPVLTLDGSLPSSEPLRKT